MTKLTFPWIALILGAVLLAGLFFAGAIPPSGEYAAPLLAMLFMSELGALISAAGAYMAFSNWLANRANMLQLIASLITAVLAVALLFTGVALWQHSVGQ